MTLASHRKKVERLLAEYRIAKKQIRMERERLDEVKEYLKCAEEAQKYLQEVAKQEQEKAHKSMAAIVTKCLKAVFDDPYEFRLVFEKKRGKTEARPAFFKGENEVDPRDGSGGGVLDVAAFGLRLGSVLLSRPRIRPLLVLDEPFRNLSSPIYRERVKDMILKLSEELKVQIILVTQTPELEMGRVIHFG